MKKILFILGMLAFTHSVFSENLYLISFPRSGSSWMMYIIQYLTRQPWDVGVNKPQIFPPLKKEVDTGLPLHYRSHSSSGLQVLRNTKRPYKPHKEGDKLILMLRNYRECTLRHFSYDKTKVHNQLHANNKSPSNYFNLISTYELWNPENRLLVYYEDLMKNPKQEIMRVSKFIGSDTDRTENFLSHLKQHADASFAQKRTPTDSKGKDLNFHSKKISPNDLKKMDTVVRANYPEYWDKYLNRYSVENTMKN